MSAVADHHPVAAELLPLQPILESNLQSQPEPELELELPRMATKNNLLKLNWWHSPTQPLDVAASLLARSPDVATSQDNNNTSARSCFNTPNKSTSEPNNHHRHHPHPPHSNERDPKRKIISSAISSVADFDETFDLQDSQLLVKGRLHFYEL